jgi:choline kinase
MWPLTRNTPKALLDLGRGVTVIESQLASIREAGLVNVTLVVGFLAEQVEAKVRRFDGLKVDFVYNPFFDVSNNLVSLWMARHVMGDEFISINGDDVFHADVLRTLAAAAQPPDITMVIDRKPRYEAEDMKVVVHADRVLEVSKQVPLDRANGESIGIIRYSGAGARAMRDMLDEMVRRPEGKTVFYLEAIQQLANQGFPIGFVEVDQTLWSEIDFHPDLDLIRQNVMRVGAHLLSESPRADT